MESLEKRIMAGDHEAFNQWMDIHIQQIERLAVQYGVAPQEAGKVAETVFEDLYNRFGQLTEEQLEEKALYKSTWQKVNGLHVIITESGLFSFEEDNDLHANLLNLSNEERIAFILSRFHETSDEDIAWIIDTSVEVANDLVQKAQRLLEGPNIDKRLEFLDTSYRRLRPSFNVNNIFNSKPTEEVLSNEPVKEMNRKRKNKPLYLWLIGSAMLVLLLTVTAFRSEAYQRSSAEKFIEDKKMSFQSELEKRFDMIGLATPDERETAFTYGNGSQFRNELFGSDINWEFNTFIRELESQVEGEGKINKKEASYRYEEIIHEMRLPSEMLEQLRSNPIKNREESIAFLNEFYIKNQFLENYYTRIIFGEQPEFFWESEINSDGVVDIDKFLKRRSEYPDELRKALDGMETQFFSLTAIKDYVPISIAYNNPEVSETLQQNLHVDIDAYLFLIMDGLNVIFLGTDSERLETLIKLDSHLPKTRESDPLVADFDNGYSWLLFVAAGFADANGIYDWNYVVREEVREKWKRIAAIGGNSPAGLVMQEVVESMEAANWKSSEENDIQMFIFERIGSEIKEVRKRKE